MRFEAIDFPEWQRKIIGNALLKMSPEQGARAVIKGLFGEKKENKKEVK